MALRIAQVGSLYENIPPPLYGGTERIISSLTEGLVENGHDVTLFATAKAQTKAKLVAVCPEPLYRIGIGKSNIMYPLLNFSEVFKLESEFDIIHFHLSISSDYISLLGAGFLSEKCIFTIHFASPALKGYPDRMLVLDRYKNLSFVSISDSARRGYEYLNWLATVYNGIELDQFTFKEKPGNYLAWIGKFNPDKGPKEAILAAKKAGCKLKLAGTIDTEDTVDRAYYEQEIKPLIDGNQIEYVGEKGGKEKDDFIGNAYGLLNPVQWEEPFGLVAVEAMAAGTPVIAFKRGALAETVKDNITGFLVNNIDEMADKIQQLPKIQRTACRNWVEKNFSAAIMVKNYEKVYDKLLNNRKVNSSY